MNAIFEFSLAPTGGIRQYITDYQTARSISEQTISSMVRVGTPKQKNLSH